MQRTLNSEDKLDALRKGSACRLWESLDERRVCVICEKSFTGRQVEASVSANGRVRLKCPTEGCPGNPRVWVRPGNPLVEQSAWEDWTRVLGKPKRRRTKTTTHT